MTNRQLLKMLDVIFYNQGKALNFCLARSAGDVTAHLRSALSAVLLLVLHVYQSPAFENVSYRFFITNIKFRPREVCWWRHSPLAFSSQRCVITYFWYYTNRQLLKMLVIVATHHLATVFSRASYKKFYYWLRLSELTNQIDPSITVDALLLILSYQSCVKYNKSLYR